mgnify:CR=1 FL=1
MDSDNKSPEFEKQQSVEKVSNTGYSDEAKPEKLNEG